MSELAVPLTASQIEAAAELSLQLDGWKRTDSALNLAGERLPGFSQEEVLLKTIIVNQLYSTSIRATATVAQHVYQVLQDADLATAGPELVESLAVVSLGETQKQWRLHSFASKFCHRFIDSTRFPILDDFAERMVRLHLGKLAKRSKELRYITFCQNLKVLRDLSGVECTSEELDRYLWLAGAYHKWKKPKLKIAAEAAELFADRNGLNQVLLSRFEEGS